MSIFETFDLVDFGVSIALNRPAIVFNKIIPGDHPFSFFEHDILLENDSQCQAKRLLCPMHWVSGYQLKYFLPDVGHLRWLRWLSWLSRLSWLCGLRRLGWLCRQSRTWWLCWVCRMSWWWCRWIWPACCRSCGGRCAWWWRSCPSTVSRIHPTLRKSDLIFFSNNLFLITWVSTMPCISFQHCR